MFRDGRAVIMGVRTVTSSLALMTAWPYYHQIVLMKVRPCYDKISEHNDNIARYDDNNTFAAQRVASCIHVPVEKFVNLMEFLLETELC
jgi:hypothetical protein